MTRPHKTLVPGRRRVVGADAPTRADERVRAFLCALRRVPIDAWGRCTRAETPVELDLHARLRGTLDQMHVLDARIRRRVDHMLAACDGIVPPQTLTEMRNAACLAAAALAARTKLTADEFTSLYGPFGALVPVEPVSTPAS